MTFDNLKISRKLAAAFAAVVVITIAMGGLVYSQIAHIRGANQTMRYQTSVMTSAMEIRMSVSRMEGAMRAFILTRNDRYTNAMQKRQDAIVQGDRRAPRSRPGSRQ